MWGTVTIGGIALRETKVADEDADTLKIVGQESHPPSTRAFVEATHRNVLGLRDQVVPVTFTDKLELSGFYLVADVRSVFTRIQEGAYQTVDWAITLLRLGSGRDVEVESRVPTVARSTTVGTPPAAVFWHAPASGATSYFTGPTVPASSIGRTSADGVLQVFLGIPAGVSPRWTVPAESYMSGSARILFDGIRRAGTFTPPLVVWQVDNGLVRLMSGPSGAITVSCWDAGAWRSPKSYAFTVNGVALTSQPELTVLRNTPEEVAVRLSYPGAPGRVHVDLSLRRGARFVTGVMKRHSSATLGVARTAAETASVVTGGLRASSADADGNRFVLGSMVTVTTTTATASIAKAAVLQLDFFLGHEVDAAPQAGDAFADLWAQYRGSTGERVRVVSR
ncbi:hypothetical protein [Blastococcus sp. CT_GayMR16]|uniref:hypothetical protein n=1 Tax=Blastococcus sp. CT_GayMR16 TaxID=2559607 RepID=UPI001073FF9E|nr:hypothetical protein [Blastococcus sp. CT_GayMR16]TFV90384.1 hypothetical protein E4P38_02790 [Blastococcus sp. CT_GayMR16]